MLLYIILSRDNEYVCDDDDDKTCNSYKYEYGSDDDIDDADEYSFLW